MYGELVTDHYKTNADTVCLDTYNGLPLKSIAVKQCFDHCVDCNSQAFIDNNVELENKQIVIPKPYWL